MTVLILQREDEGSMMSCESFFFYFGYSTEEEEEAEEFSGMEMSLHSMEVEKLLILFFPEDVCFKCPGIATRHWLLCVRDDFFNFYPSPMSSQSTTKLC